MNAIQENTGLFRKLQSTLIEDKDLYDAFVASTANALKELPRESDLEDVAKAVADRIIGKE